VSLQIYAYYRRALAATKVVKHRLSVCTHSPGTNSTKAMAAMLVFQAKESLPQKSLSHTHIRMLGDCYNLYQQKYLEFLKTLVERVLRNLLILLH
jgi:hypothetical protein